MPAPNTRPPTSCATGSRGRPPASALATSGETPAATRIGSTSSCTATANAERPQHPGPALEDRAPQPAVEAQPPASHHDARDQTRGEPDQGVAHPLQHGARWRLRRRRACNVRGMSDNSFDARATLQRRRPRTRDLPARRAAVAPRRRAPAVLAQDPAREPAPHRGQRRPSRRRTSRRSRPGTRRREPEQGDRLHARAACSCRTSPASPPSSTSPRCATRWPTSAATRRKINPLVPAELVIDHSVQVDEFGTPAAFAQQRRARVRAQPRALRVPALGPGRVRQLQGRAAGHRHRPPGQPRVPRPRRLRRRRGPAGAYPDTLVGTDSHTTMINGLGVLGWGVGGIEAEAAMLGQPMSMLIPQVVGFQLHGELPEGATATDLVLTVTQMLREKGVVGKFVEFFGPGLADAPARRPRDDRQHGPGVRRDLRDLPDRRRDAALPRVHRPPEEQVELVEAYAKEQGLWHDEHAEEPTYTDTLELDLATVVPSLAGPKRPQDRVALSDAKEAFREALAELRRRRRDDGRRRRGVAERSRPATRRPTGARQRRRRPARAARRPRPTRRSPSAAHAVAGRRSDGTDVRARPRPRRDRRDHELHEHLEPVGHARRRACSRRRRSRSGLKSQAVGQDVARARARRSSPSTSSAPA